VSVIDKKDHYDEKSNVFAYFLGYLQIHCIVETIINDSCDRVTLEVQRLQDGKFADRKNGIQFSNFISSYV